MALELRRRCRQGVHYLRIKKYLVGGRKPWSRGYNEYKEKYLREVLRNSETIDSFSQRTKLPDGFGFRLDERVVEYPWVLSRLEGKRGRLLDAGSALNFDYILDSGTLKNFDCLIFSLTPEDTYSRTNVTYMYGDLRNTGLGPDIIDEIVCLSTLEHIGMDNTFLYSENTDFNEAQTDDYKKVIAECKRLLVPGGRLLITVPYGKYANIGWLQQFDALMVQGVIDCFQPVESDVTYFIYKPDGWHTATADECRHCEYYDIHHSLSFGHDYAAAARAVACIELKK